MHARLVAAVMAAVEEVDAGVKVNVTSLSAGLGIAPKTFYKWANRYRAEGVDGLAERSRRPHRSPRQVSPAVEDAVVEMRKRLLELGADAGAGTIRWHLGDEGASRPPSEATIHRILVRRGQVVPQPHKRPKLSWRRFEASAPNERWQIDATDWSLADGTTVEIINVIDDHSRLAVACIAVPTTTSRLAWEAFSLGAARYGTPAGCLSDNGLAFSGKLRGFEVYFEAQLRVAGVRTSTAAPFHPQTCGKVERFQQTEKKWLSVRSAADLAELQDHLDGFRDYYNLERPHRGIGGRTPQQRWEASPVARAAREALPPPQRWATTQVNKVGTVAAGHALTIGVGVDYTGKTAHIRIAGNHAWVIIDGHLARELDIDPTRPYQPTGKTGRRRRRR